MATTPISPRDAAIAAMATAALILEATLLGGCGGQAVDGTGDAARNAGTTRPAARVYPFAQKDRFILDMAGELAAIERDFDRLFPRVEIAGRPVQGVVIPDIDALRGLAADLGRQLAAARDATAAQWPALTAAFARDLARLRDGLERSRLKLAGPLAE